MTEATAAARATARPRDTGDLAFAAFCMLRGLRVLRAQEHRPNGRGPLEYRFTFSDPPSPEAPEGRWDTLRVEFANSEAARFDAAVRSLKKLCKTGGE
jgi:hypothetical protein